MYPIAPSGIRTRHANPSIPLYSPVSDDLHLPRAPLSVAFMDQTGMMRVALVAALACSTFASSPASAQATKIRVLGPDSLPIPFAWVSVQGGDPVIADERGEVAIGNARRKSLSVTVRRIGYTPWLGTIAFPDTAAAIAVSLTPMAQTLGGVTVTAQARNVQLALTGFYDRVQMRQKGLLSATFIGPEEMEQRHPGHISDMLYGRLGVVIVRPSHSVAYARGINGTCLMTILLDGNRLCPPGGCSAVPSGVFATMTRQTAGPASQAKALSGIVNLDQYIDPSDIAAIEIYARGGNMPVGLQADDSSCGVIAFWSGARR